MHDVPDQVHWHEPTGGKRAGFGKFGRPKTPYDSFMEAEGIPVFRDIGVSKVQNLPLAPWKRTGARHFDDVAAPFALGAVQLNIAAAPAQARPWLQRQVLHFAHADVAVNRNAFGFHEQIIWRLRSAEFAEAGALET